MSFPLYWGGNQILKCHYHAGMITEISDYAWKPAKLDIHKISVGQILTVSAAIIMHTHLIATGPEEIELVRES